MRAWLLDEMTGIERLRMGTVADPVAGPGEAVLQVECAALNPADYYLAMGHYPARPPLPHILGRDGVGTVLGVGQGVSSVGVGERMMILRGETGVTRGGTFAERVAVATDSLVSPPAGWNIQESAGAALVYLTAWQALTQWNDLPTGAVVLVTGASGGVGVASVHLGKAMGHRMIALSRDVKKQARLREMGADFAISPVEADWRKKAREAMGGGKVDLVIDNIGGWLLPEVIDSLGDGGRMSVVGRLAGPVPEFNTASLLFRRLKMGGVAVGAYTAAESQAAWKQVVAILMGRGLRPVVDSVWEFDKLSQAFSRLAAGPMGKVILDVRNQGQGAGK